MPFTLTARGTTEANYSSGSAVGDTFTPAEDDVIVLIVNKNNATALSSVSGWSATWSQVGIYSSGDHHLHIWAARIGASPSSGQASFTTVSSTFSADVIQIAGVDNTGSVASKFLQSVSNSVYGTGGQTTVALPTMAAFGSPTNLVLKIGADQNSLSHIADTGFTILQQTVDATNDFHTTISYQEGEDLTCNIVNNGAFDYKYLSGVAFEIEEGASGASLSDVDTDEILEDGQTAVVSTHANFTTNPDSGKLVSGAFEYSLTNFSSNATTATGDIQDVANLSSSQAGVPFTSASHNINMQLDNSVEAESASLAITLNPTTGWAVTELTGVDNSHPASVTKNFTGTPPNTSQIVLETANNTSIDAQARITSDVITGTIQARYWDAVTGIWQPFNIIMENGVPVAIRFIKGVSITSTSITSSAITGEEL